MFYIHIFDIINSNSAINTCRLDTTTRQPKVVVVHKNDSTREKFSEWMMSTFWGTISPLSSQQLQRYEAVPIVVEDKEEIKGGKTFLKVITEPSPNLTLEM